MEMQIIEVGSSGEMKDFIYFPLEHYKTDKNFVFEPYLFQKDFFSKKNPFFEHSSARYFMAESGNRLIGRIAAITNTIHNKTYNESTGFFGFFEVIDDYQAAKLLLDKVKEVHINNGFDRIAGPTNFTTNDSCGLLISGFEYDPVFLMPYNKAYYADFLYRYGYEQLMDLSSYFLNAMKLQPFFNSPVFRSIEDRLADDNICIRPINFRNFKSDIHKLWHLYNSSNENNWGFVPLTWHEFFTMAENFRKLIPEDFILFAEYKNEIIGFIVALPDYNQVFKKISDGKLFPFGLLKFLWYKRKINQARIMILGVDKLHRSRGIDMILYKKITENIGYKAIYDAEACYVMSSNRKMNYILKKMEGDDFKKYRIFSYGLTAYKKDLKT